MKKKRSDKAVYKKKPKTETVKLWLTTTSQSKNRKQNHAEFKF